MSQVRSYRDLDVWKDAMDLVADVYAVTRAFPKYELYGLAIQTRRAAMSIPSNIAEGNGRLYRKEYAHYVSIARGSVAELSTCLEIALRLGYVGAELVEALLRRADAISRMLLRLVRALDQPKRTAG